jgi:mono/diheme cytochrome c family protein
MSLKRLPVSAAVAAGALVFALSASAQNAPTWNNSIGAIFAASCTRCHGGNAGSAQLRLTTYALAIAGSRNGPVLIAGDPDSSLLMQRIRGQIPPRMPRGAPALPTETIAWIAAWIQAGMPE